MSYVYWWITWSLFCLMQDNSHHLWMHPTERWILKQTSYDLQLLPRQVNCTSNTLQQLMADSLWYKNVIRVLGYPRYDIISIVRLHCHRLTIATVLALTSGALILLIWQMMMSSSWFNARIMPRKSNNKNNTGTVKQHWISMQILAYIA